MEAVRLLEKMRKYECAMLVPYGSCGRALLVFDDTSITLKREDYDPISWGRMYTNIEGRIHYYITEV